MATAVVARDSASDPKATAPMNLAYPPARPIGRLQRLWLGKTDPMMHRALPSRELPESANRSIARRAQRAVASTTRRPPPRRLDKQCLLIEVRLQDPA